VCVCVCARARVCVRAYKASSFCIIPILIPSIFPSTIYLYLFINLHVLGRQWGL
jgi:hypothetical protein